MQNPDRIRNSVNMSGYICDKAADMDYIDDSNGPSQAQIDTATAQAVVEKVVEVTARTASAVVDAVCDVMEVYDRQQEILAEQSKEK